MSFAASKCAAACRMRRDRCAPGGGDRSSRSARWPCPAPCNPSRRWSTGASGVGSRPAQDAHRGGAAPGALVDARQRNAHRCRLLQANYSAVQPVAQVGVGKFGVLVAGVDLDAQVDVALADLDQVDARAQLAAERLRLGALDVEVRSNTRPGARFRSRPYRRKGKAPKRCIRPGTSRKRSDSSYVAAALVRTRILASPLAFRRQCLQAPALHSQSRIEKVGRVCSKSLIENTLSL